MKGNAEEGRIDNCVPWTRIPGSEHHRRPSLSSSNMWSQARLNLSTDAHALYLIARGAMKSGAFYVGESHDAKDVSVTIFVHHRDEDTLSHAGVCRLSREDGQIGVGLFVRRPIRCIFFGVLTFAPADFVFASYALARTRERRALRHQSGTSLRSWGSSIYTVFPCGPTHVRFDSR